MSDVYEWRSLKDAEQDGFHYADRELDHMQRELDMMRGRYEGAMQGYNQIERMYRQLLEAIAPIRFPPITIGGRVEHVDDDPLNNDPKNLRIRP